MPPRVSVERAALIPVDPFQAREPCPCHFCGNHCLHYLQEQHLAQTGAAFCNGLICEHGQGARGKGADANFARGLCLATSTLISHLARSGPGRPARARVGRRIASSSLSGSRQLMLGAFGGSTEEALICLRDDHGVDLHGRLSCRRAPYGTSDSQKQVCEETRARHRPFGVSHLLIV